MKDKSLLLLCTMCARGGSKGVPGKNIRPLAGVPLIAHSIDQARRTGLFLAIAVSSDSDSILAEARRYGADLVIKRPDVLATDTSGKLPAIVHALTETETRLGVNADYLFDLDATSPLRDPDDIVACVDLLRETGCSSVITGTPSHRSPYFNLVERDSQGFIKLSKPLPDLVLRRQDSPECFDMNGSVYGWRRDVLREDPKVIYPDTRLHVMPRNRSWDVDEETDFAIIELMMELKTQAASKT